MNKETGGAAFPIGTKEIRYDSYSGRKSDAEDGFQPGMTLRDYFAAKAMQALLSNSSITTNKLNSPIHGDHFAEWVYQIADEMLAERAK